MKTCKFCNKKVKSLVDAHIIPKAFFEYTKGKAGVDKSMFMQVFTNTESGFPIKRSRIGWYDPNLVCIDCERLFQVFDNYGIDLLLKDEQDHLPVIINEKIAGWTVRSYDYEKLTLFFVSILWRAGATELKQFSKIIPSQWLNRAKNCIITGENIQDGYFSYILARYQGTIGLSFALDPHPEVKGDGFGDLNIYRFYLGAGYVVYIKADARPFPDLINFANEKDLPLMIISRGELEKSKEFEVLRKITNDVDITISKIKRKS